MFDHPLALTYRLKLLLLLDQELQHQVNIRQVQVLLVRIQRVLEQLPPGPVLEVRDSHHLQMWKPQLIAL